MFTFFNRIRFSYFLVHSINSFIKLFDYCNYCDQRRRNQKQDRRQRYEVSQEVKDIEEHGVKSVMPVKVSSPKRRRMELVAATAALVTSIAAFCFIASS